MQDYNVGPFFRSFLEAGADNRIIISYDSMSSSSGTLVRSTISFAIATTWQIPNLGDGSPGWVGIGDGGHHSFGKSFTGPDFGTHGYTKWNARSPGGNVTPASMVTFPTGDGITGGLASGGESGVASQHFADWNIQGGGSARTAFTVEPNQAGCLFMTTSGKSATDQSPTHVEPMHYIGAGDIFSGRQCHSRFLFTKNTKGPTDCQIIGIRQASLSFTLSLVNTSFLDRATFSMNVGAGIEPGYVDIDCGAGVGSPGYLVTNPTSVGAGVTPLHIYHTGRRIFRSSGGNPIAGTSIADLAVGSQSLIHHASLMGVAGVLGGEPSTRNSPDPYVSAANARAYVSALAGRTGSSNLYPNKVIIYTGHNKTTNIVAELVTGESATALDAVLRLMQQHDANAIALGSELPDYLIVHCEKFDTGYTITQINNYRKTMRRAAVDFGPRASYIDLHYRTDDGSPLDTPMWYSVGRAVAAVAGPAAKTITAISAAAAAVVTATAHGYSNGQTVNIIGTNSTPSIDGRRVVTVIDANNFSVPVTTSVTGTAGTVYVGPITDPARDDVHNNFAGNRFIWGMVWQIGMRALGYEPDNLGAGETRRPIVPNRFFRS
jgi:hypothetical protein